MMAGSPVNWLNDHSPIEFIDRHRKTDSTPEPGPFPPAAEELLASVAAALTACDAAGYEVKLKHGAVMTRVGYVLPLGDGQWCARTLNWSPFGVQVPGDDED